MRVAGLRYAKVLEVIGSSFDECSGTRLACIDLTTLNPARLVFWFPRPQEIQSNKLESIKEAVRGRQLTVARKNTAIPEGKERRSVICRLRNRKSTDVKSQPMLKESPIITVLNKDSESSINMELFPVYSVFLGGRKRT